jgi:hypothetical protein
MDKQVPFLESRWFIFDRRPFDLEFRLKAPTIVRLSLKKTVDKKYGNSLVDRCFALHICHFHFSEL